MKYDLYLISQYKLFFVYNYFIIFSVIKKNLKSRFILISRNSFMPCNAVFLRVYFYFIYICVSIYTHTFSFFQILSLSYHISLNGLIPFFASGYQFSWASQAPKYLRYFCSGEFLDKLPWLFCWTWRGEGSLFSEVS